jgi:hypothetical protein
VDNVILRPASSEDVKVLGGAHGRTIRAFAASRGKDLLGLAGVYYCGTVSFGTQVVAFLHLCPGVVLDPMTVGAGGLWMRRLMRKLGMPVMAVRDEEIPGADRLLTVMGFTQVEDAWWWFPRRN